jgi:polyisoprenoid-binding protein YceI
VARYQIVPERSTLWAEARSSVHPIKLQTNGLEGYIDAEFKEGLLDLTVPPKAHVEIEVELLKSGNSLYDRELERRVDTQRYPFIRGDVLEVKHVRDNLYRVRGNLSFHGQTRSIEGEVSVRVLDDSAIEAEGEKVIDVRDFNLEPPKFLMLRVYPDVKVRARVTAKRQA